jgi:hypothetical protein
LGKSFSSMTFSQEIQDGIGLMNSFPQSQSAPNPLGKPLVAAWLLCVLRASAVIVAVRNDYPRY